MFVFCFPGIKVELDNKEVEIFPFELTDGNRITGDNGADIQNIGSLKIKKSTSDVQSSKSKPVVKTPSKKTAAVKEITNPGADVGVEPDRTDSGRVRNANGGALGDGGKSLVDDTRRPKPAVRLQTKDASSSVDVGIDVTNKNTSFKQISLSPRLGDDQEDESMPKINFNAEVVTKNDVISPGFENGSESMKLTEASSVEEKLKSEDDGEKIAAVVIDEKPKPSISSSMANISREAVGQKLKLKPVDRNVSMKANSSRLTAKIGDSAVADHPAAPNAVEAVESIIVDKPDSDVSKTAIDQKFRLKPISGKLSVKKTSETADVAEVIVNKSICKDAKVTWPVEIEAAVPKKDIQAGQLLASECSESVRSRRTGSLKKSKSHEKSHDMTPTMDDDAKSMAKSMGTLLTGTVEKQIESEAGDEGTKLFRSQSQKLRRVQKKTSGLAMASEEAVNPDLERIKKRSTVVNWDNIGKAKEKPPMDDAADSGVNNREFGSVFNKLKKHGHATSPDQEVVALPGSVQIGSVDTIATKSKVTPAILLSTKPDSKDAAVIGSSKKFGLDKYPSDAPDRGRNKISPVSEIQKDCVGLTPSASLDKNYKLSPSLAARRSQHIDSKEPSVLVNSNMMGKDGDKMLGTDASTTGKSISGMSTSQTIAPKSGMSLPLKPVSINYGSSGSRRVYRTSVSEDSPMSDEVKSNADNGTIAMVSFIKQQEPPTAANGPEARLKLKGGSVADVNSMNSGMDVKASSLHKKDGQTSSANRKAPVAGKISDPTGKRISGSAGVDAVTKMISDGKGIEATSSNSAMQKQAGDGSTLSDAAAVTNGQQRRLRSVHSTVKVRPADAGIENGGVDGLPAWAAQAKRKSSQWKAMSTDGAVDFKEIKSDPASVEEYL